MDSRIEMSYRSPTTPLSPDAVSISTDKPLLSEDSYYADNRSPRSRAPWRIQVGDRDADGPKPVIRRTAPRILTGWLAHAPAIIVTCLLIWISHTQVFWYPESGPDVPFIGLFGNKHTVVSNLLQFASKLHEIIVVASLAAIALSMFRRRLVGEGVRLGFLTGGYRVGDLAYLTSGAFWALGRNLKPSDIILVVFVVFGTIMSTIIGPASAILFVPSLGWYDVPGAFDTVKMPLTYYLGVEDAWPHHIDNTTLNFIKNPVCLTTESIFTHECAAGGFPTIWNWLGGFRYTDLENNLTFSRELSRRLELHQNNSVVLFTTPSSFAMTSMGLFTNHIQKSNDLRVLSDTHRYKLTTTTPMKQPFVQGKCVVYDKDELIENNEKPFYPTSFLNCHGDADCLATQQDPPPVNEALWNRTGHGTAPSFNWYHGADTKTKSVIKIGGIMPYVSKNMEQKTWVYGCNFLARWVPSELSVDPRISDVISSNVSSPDAMNKLFADGASERSTIIQIENSWLQGISPFFNITSLIFQPEKRESSGQSARTTPMEMIINRLLYRHQKEDGDYVRYLDTIDDNTDPKLFKSDTESFIARAYGVFFTDSLARTSSDRQTLLVLEENKDNTTWTDLAVQNGLWSGAHSYVSVENNKSYPTKEIWNNNFHEAPLTETVEQLIQGFRDRVQIGFKAERHGYGSGQDSKTLQFALAMMYIYLGVMAIYGAAVVSSHILDWVDCAMGGRRLDLKSVTAWSDLQDLALLALRSSPPADGDLAHVGAGVKSSSVWNKVAMVRVADDNALQLVLQDEGSKARPRKGEKYS